MDKKKQEIIEISLAVKNAFMKPLKECLYPEYENCIGKYCEQFISGVPCRFLGIAEHLYELGYRKTPENAVLTNNDVGELLNIVAKDTRKETAEKFAERLKHKLLYGWFTCFSEIETYIDEICKEFTEDNKNENC